MSRQSLQNLIDAIERDTRHSSNPSFRAYECRACRVCRALHNAKATLAHLEPLDVLTAHADRIAAHKNLTDIRREPPALIRKICEALLRCTNKEPS